MFGEAGARGLFSLHPILSGLAVGSAAAAATILIWFLWKKPPFDGTTKVLLFFGFGVLPISAAMSGNLLGFEHTQQRNFCGSCHIMAPFVADSNAPRSTTLPAIHGRNETFGPNNCYECHSDYGMFGTVATKWGGLHHVWAYYTSYMNVPVETALPELATYHPFPNANCIRCHSTQTPGWRTVGEHRSLVVEIRDGRASCMSAGCHGPAHPFAGPSARARAQEESAP